MANAINEVNLLIIIENLLFTPIAFKTQMIPRLEIKIKEHGWREWNS